MSEFASLIADSIASARAAADVGQMDEAVSRFDLCRNLLADAAPPEPLRRRIAAETNTLAAEADSMAALLLGRSHDAAQRRVMIISDSLGLPRLEERDEFEEAVKSVYASRILDMLAERGTAAVDAHCQRYFTTDDALDFIKASPERLDGAHFFLHLGLNDCAVRMFMPAQRHAMGLLPKAVADALLSFVRDFREALVTAFPTHQYVPLDRFGANLAAIASEAKRAGALSVSFATLLTPPLRFWRRTPQVCRTFTAYNLRVMDTAAECGALVIDVDRLFWSVGVDRLATPDGMHLAPAGHANLARTFTIGRFGVSPKAKPPAKTIAIDAKDLA